MFRLLKLENIAYEHLMQGRNSCRMNVNVKDPLDINVKGYDP